MFQMRLTQKILCFTCLTLSLCMAAACDDEDDIGSIFSGKTWYVSGGEINGNPIVGDNLKSIYAVASTYMIYFSADQSFTGVLAQGSSIAGTWKANGKNNSMTLQFSKSDNVNASALSNNIYNVLKDAKSYSGDENNIMIKEDSHNYIRFTNKRNLSE